MHVDNVAPSIAISGAANVNEGSVYSLTLGAVTDPGTDTVTELDRPLGRRQLEHLRDGGAKTHTYADGPGHHAITSTWSTRTAPSSTGRTRSRCTVDNVAPTVAFSGAANVDEGSVDSLTLGAISDPGTDTVTSSSSTGDGNSSTYSSNGVKSHTFADGSDDWRRHGRSGRRGRHVIDRANALSVMSSTSPRPRT